MTRWFEPMTKREDSHVTTLYLVLFVENLDIFFLINSYPEPAEYLYITSINQPKRPK